MKGNTASGLGIEILDANMRPVKLNDPSCRDAVDPTGTRTEQYFAYSARLKSTQKSVNPGLVRASRQPLPLNFNNQSQI